VINASEYAQAKDKIVTEWVKETGSAYGPLKAAFEDGAAFGAALTSDEVEVVLDALDSQRDRLAMGGDINRGWKKHINRIDAVRPKIAALLHPIVEAQSNER
jgi:hypothetical protein